MLKKQLEEKHNAKVLLLDTKKMSEDLLNPITCKTKIDDMLKSFGPVDIIIHNDYNTKDDFIIQEDRNIREFLNVIWKIT